MFYSHKEKFPDRADPFPYTKQNTHILYRVDFEESENWVFTNHLELHAFYSDMIVNSEMGKLY